MAADHETADEKGASSSSLTALPAWEPEIISWKMPFYNPFFFPFLPQAQKLKKQQMLTLLPASPPLSLSVFLSASPE